MVLMQVANSVPSEEAVLSLRCCGVQVANSVPSEEAVLSLRCCGDAGG